MESKLVKYAVLGGALILAIICLFGCAPARQSDLPGTPQLVIEGGGAAASPEPVIENTPEPTLTPAPGPTPKPVDTSLWSLIVVSEKSFLPKDFSVELEKVQNDKKVDARIADAVRSMIADAAADGVELIIQSSYRSVEHQERLFANKVERVIKAGTPKEDAEAVAAMVVARPRTSEHHTGLAMDIVTPEYRELEEGFEDTKAFSWLCENAAEYGFTLRYPKDKSDVTGIVYEPWHWRYVGTEAALAMRQSGQCLEEYVGMA